MVSRLAALALALIFGLRRGLNQSSSSELVSLSEPLLLTVIVLMLLAVSAQSGSLQSSKDLPHLRSRRTFFQDGK